MKHFYLLVLLVSTCLTNLHAQTDSVYTSLYLSRSTKFAWTTLGADILTLPGGSADVLSAANTLEERNFGSTVSPRLHIGGVHFWGHADFYVTFPLSFWNYTKASPDFPDRQHTHGIETGARFYPIALAPGRLRPFAGLSFRLQTYGHQMPGVNTRYGYPVYQRMIKPLQVGVTYATKRHLISASLYFQGKSTFNYAITQALTGMVRPNPVTFNVSFSAYWDTDKSMREPRGVAQENIKYHILEDAKKLSAWYWAVGASAALQMSKSPLFKQRYPYLYNDFVGGFTPDLSIGRYFNRPGMSAGISYRTIGSTVKGFDTRAKLRRHSFMLEVHKDLFNYLGFVPFAGLTTSMESLRTTINDKVLAEWKPAIGIIMGWDIRVTKTGTNVLRTNLRWIPDLHSDFEGEKVMYDNLEFNFIQWVQFIGRKEFYRQHKSK